MLILYFILFYVLKKVLVFFSPVLSMHKTIMHIGFDTMKCLRCTKNRYLRKKADTVSLAECHSEGNIR